MIYHQDPHILRIQDPESWKWKDRQFSRIWGSWILRISNYEIFEILRIRILKSSKITNLWIFRIQDPESSGLRILDKGPWILKIWYPQFFNTIITCQGHISKVVQSIWNSKGYLKDSALWQRQIWGYAKKTTASESESDIIWCILPIKQNHAVQRSITYFERPPYSES